MAATVSRRHAAFVWKAVPVSGGGGGGGSGTVPVVGEWWVEDLGESG